MGVKSWHTPSSLLATPVSEGDYSVVAKLGCITDSPQISSGLQSKGLFLPMSHVGFALAVVMLHIHFSFCNVTVLLKLRRKEAEPDCTVTFKISAQTWSISHLLTFH